MSGNQKIQYGRQAAIFKVTSLKINRLLPMVTINMHMKFEIEIPKQTWLMLRKPCRLQTDGRTDKVNPVYTNDQIISNHMNKFFCNIGKQLQSRIPNYGDDYRRYLPQSVNKTFFLTPVHSDELIKEIKSLNPKSQVGLTIYKKKKNHKLVSQYICWKFNENFQ